MADGRVLVGPCDGDRRLTWYVPAMEMIGIAVIGGVVIGMLIATLLISSPKKKEPRESDEENRPPG